MRNWRTTLLGAIGAVFQAAVGVSQVTNGNFDNKAGWFMMGSAAFTALLGYFSKDAGVTGAEK